MAEDIKKAYLNDITLATELKSTDKALITQEGEAKLLDLNAIKSTVEVDNTTITRNSENKLQLGLESEIEGEKVYLVNYSNMIVLRSDNKNIFFYGDNIFLSDGGLMSENNAKLNLNKLEFQTASSTTSYEFDKISFTNSNSQNITLKYPKGYSDSYAYITTKVNGVKAGSDGNIQLPVNTTQSEKFSLQDTNSLKEIKVTETLTVELRRNDTVLLLGVNSTMPLYAYQANRNSVHKSNHQVQDTVHQIYKDLKLDGSENIKILFRCPYNNIKELNIWIDMNGLNCTYWLENKHIEYTP